MNTDLQLSSFCDAISGLSIVFIGEFDAEEVATELEKSMNTTIVVIEDIIEIYGQFRAGDQLFGRIIAINEQNCHFFRS